MERVEQRDAVAHVGVEVELGLRHRLGHEREAGAMEHGVDFVLVEGLLDERPVADAAVDERHAGRHGRTGGP